MDQSRLIFHDGSMVDLGTDTMSPEVRVEKGLVLGPNDRLVSCGAPNVLIPKADTALHTYKLLMNIKSRTKRSNDKDEEDEAPVARLSDSEDSSDESESSEDSEVSDEEKLNSDDDS